MTGHTARFVINDGCVDVTYQCHEPETALCRADWNCECETWQLPRPDAAGNWTHQGHYVDPCTSQPGGNCNITPWWQEGVEDLHDSFTITVPVSPVWEDDYYTAMLTPGATTATITQETP